MKMKPKIIILSILFSVISFSCGYEPPGGELSETTVYLDPTGFDLYSSFHQDEIRNFDVDVKVFVNEDIGESTLYSSKEVTISNETTSNNLEIKEVEVPSDGSYEVSVEGIGTSCYEHCSFSLECNAFNFGIPTFENSKSLFNVDGAPPQI